MGDKYKGWTMKDLKYLTEQYPTQPIKSISEAIGKTQGAVKTRAQLLGLKRQSNIYALYHGELFLAQGTIKEIAKKTGYSVNSVKNFGTPYYQNNEKNKRPKKVLIKLDLDEEEMECE